MKERSLGYNDITLIPRVVSEIESRDDIEISLDYAGRKLSIPLIAAPMPDVCGGEMAKNLLELGAYAYIHRFNTIEEQVAEYKLAPGAGCAIGITGDYLERFKTLFNEGCDSFVIDVANGANTKVRKVIEELSFQEGQKYICVGNVCSQECYKYLYDMPEVNYIRGGIAGGSVCTTRLETGIFNPMVSMLLECASVEESQNWHKKLIADGSIKEPQDMCKALVLGASICMAGSIFAGCEESPGHVLKIDGKLYKVFRGAASFSTQRQVKNSVKYVEGNETIVPYTGPVKRVIERFRNGLLSSMSYMNAKNLHEYKMNADWSTL